MTCKSSPSLSFLCSVRASHYNCSHSTGSCWTCRNLASPFQSLEAFLYLSPLRLDHWSPPSVPPQLLILFQTDHTPVPSTPQELCLTQHAAPETLMYRGHFCFLMSSYKTRKLSCLYKFHYSAIFNVCYKGKSQETLEFLWLEGNKKINQHFSD